MRLFSVLGLAAISVAVLVACGNSDFVPEQSDMQFLFKERLVVYEPENEQVVARYNYSEETTAVRVQVAWWDLDGNVGVDMVDATREGDTNVFAIKVEPVEGRRYTFNALFRNGDHILESLEEYWSKSSDSVDQDGIPRVSEGEMADRNRRYLTYVHPVSEPDSEGLVGDPGSIDSVVDDLPPLLGDRQANVRITKAEWTPPPPAESSISPVRVTARWELEAGGRPLGDTDVTVLISDGFSIEAVKAKTNSAGAVTVSFDASVERLYVIDLAEVAGRKLVIDDEIEELRQRFILHIRGTLGEPVQPTPATTQSTPTPQPTSTASPRPTSTTGSANETCTPDRFDRGEIEVVNAWAEVVEDPGTGWTITYGWEFEAKQHPTSGSTPTLNGIIVNYEISGPDPFIPVGANWDYVIDAPNFEKVTFVQTPGEYVFKILDFDQAGSYCGDGDLIVVEIE